MSNHETLLRHQKIINMLRHHKTATFNEILDYLVSQSEIAGYDLTLSLRTFQRELNEIRSLYNVDIQYDRSSKVYHIVEEDSDLHDRLMEAFDTISALKISEGLSEFISFEKRKPHGTHHFFGLLHAIRNRLTITLKHQKFDDDMPLTRQVEPLGLKESRGRWYLIANEVGRSTIKSYGLDRILDFDYTKKTFSSPIGFNINEHFKYCFGVINDADQLPQEVILSFDPDQGMYIKTYPIQETQTILVDNGDELRVKLLIKVTYDLEMEILSYGDRVKVIAPEELMYEISRRHKQAHAQYS